MPAPRSFVGGCVDRKSGKTSQKHGDKLGKRSKAAHPGPPHTFGLLPWYKDSSRHRSSLSSLRLMMYKECWRTPVLLSFPDNASAEVLRGGLCRQKVRQVRQVRKNQSKTRRQTWQAQQSCTSWTATHFRVASMVQGRLKAQVFTLFAQADDIQRGCWRTPMLLSFPDNASPEVLRGGCVVSKSDKSGKSGKTSQKHGDKLGKRSKAAHPGPPHTFGLLPWCKDGSRHRSSLSSLRLMMYKECWRTPMLLSFPDNASAEVLRGGCVVRKSGKSGKSGKTSQKHGDKLGKRSKAAHPGPPHTFGLLPWCKDGSRHRSSLSSLRLMTSRFHAHDYSTGI